MEYDLLLAAVVLTGLKAKKYRRRRSTTCIRGWSRAEDEVKSFYIARARAVIEIMYDFWIPDSGIVIYGDTKRVKRFKLGSLFMHYLHALMMMMMMVSSMRMPCMALQHGATVVGSVLQKQALMPCRTIGDNRGRDGGRVRTNISLVGGEPSIPVMLLR